MGCILFYKKVGGGVRKVSRDGAIHFFCMNGGWCNTKVRHNTKHRWFYFYFATCKKKILMAME
jgi:hypothetical protein